MPPKYEANSGRVATAAIASRVRGDVAEAAALRDQAPPGPQRPAQPGEEAVVVEDPVEGRGREDQVDRLFDFKLGEVGDQVGRAFAQPLARLATIASEASTASRLPAGRRSTSLSATRPDPQPASIAASSPRSSSRSSTSIPQLNWGSEIAS